MHTIDRNFKAITIPGVLLDHRQTVHPSPFNSKSINATHVCCYGNKETTNQFHRSSTVYLIRSYLQQPITGGQYGRILHTS